MSSLYVASGVCNVDDSSLFSVNNQWLHLYNRCGK